MNYKLTENNFEKAADLFCSLTKEQQENFKQEHNFIFMERYPSLREITNAFLKHNVRVAFSFDYSNDIIYRIWFPNEEVSDFDETIFK